MLRLAKAFLDIALWRQTPAHLPASLFLLVLVAAAAALTGGAGRAAPAAARATESRMRVDLERRLAAGFRLGWCWRLHGTAQRVLADRDRAAGRRGAGGAGAVSVGLACSASSAIDESRSIPVGLLLFVGFIWYLLACAHIWRAALDSGLALGGRHQRGIPVVVDAYRSSSCCRKHDDAHPYIGHRRHLHGRCGRDRQGRRISRHRIGSQRVSADEHAAASARHRVRAGLRRRSAGSAARHGGGRKCVEPRQSGDRGHARPRHAVHLRAAVACRAGAARAAT